MGWQGEILVLSGKLFSTHQNFCYVPACHGFLVKVEKDT